MNLYYITPGLVVGRISKTPGGYRWLPFTSAQRSSRKDWPTPEAAIKGRARGGKIVEAKSVQDASEMAHALKLSRDAEEDVPAKIDPQTEGWVGVIRRPQTTVLVGGKLVETTNGWIPASAVPTGAYVSTQMKIKCILLATDIYDHAVIGWYMGGLLKRYYVAGSCAPANPTHWRLLPELPET